MDKKIITFNLIYKFYALMRKKAELLKYYSESSSKPNPIEFESCQLAIDSLNFEFGDNISVKQEDKIELNIVESPTQCIKITISKEAEA